MSASSRPAAAQSSSTDASSPWVQYYDETSSAYYWFNNDTGESRWADDECRQEGEEDQAPLFPAQHDSRTEGPTLQSFASQRATEEVRVEWRRSIARYYCFSLANMLVCEAPACLVEAVLRILMLCALLILSLLGALFRRVPAAQARDFISCTVRDMLLTFAAAVSLLVPGLVCFVYRGFRQSNAYNGEEDVAENDVWELRSIPTFLGAVDCRRFAVITVFGAGSMASNAVYTAQPQGRDVCRDAWEKSVVYYPRNVLQRLQSMI